MRKGWLSRIFHEARCARREKCLEAGHSSPVSLSPTVCVGPVVSTQTVGSKFRRYASEFASASMHLLARTLHVRAIFGLVFLASVAGCAAIGGQRHPAGSIAGAVRADRYGLEVAETTQDQARQEILTTPTVFDVSFEDDPHSWERARFFLENYIGASSGHSSALTKVVGSRWSLESNPALVTFRYEVSKDEGAHSFTYRVSCIPAQNGDVGQAALNAGNFARFIRDGKLEMSLLKPR
jgi:hypothetical protein